MREEFYIPLLCVQCGAPLADMTQPCAYCGTTHYRVAPMPPDTWKGKPIVQPVVMMSASTDEDIGWFSQLLPWKL